MSILRIYMDEAGTMPLSDSDKPFVVSAVGIRGQHPEFSSYEGKSNWLCSKLVELGAFANCSIVIPRLGYGSAIQKKLDKMDIMAVATRKITGANAHYLTPSGLQKRYVLYNHCMQDVLQGPLLRSILTSPVDRVEIYLDQMTMAPGTRRMFLSHVRKMRQRLFDTVDSMRGIKPSYAHKVRDNIRFTDIMVAWSDEDETQGAKDGLTLAHYLASLRYRDLVANRNVLHDEMLQSGYNDYERDITDQVLRPLSRDSVAEWEENTGLLEPEV